MIGRALRRRRHLHLQKGQRHPHRRRVLLGRLSLHRHHDGGSIDGVIAAADRVLALAKSDTMFIPGHGPVANRARLERYRAMLVTVRDRVAKLAGERKTLEQAIAAKPTADPDADWPLQAKPRQSHGLPAPRLPPSDENLLIH